MEKKKRSTIAKTVRGAANQIKRLEKKIKSVEKRKEFLEKKKANPVVCKNICKKAKSWKRKRGSKKGSGDSGFSAS